MDTVYNNLVVCDKLENLPLIKDLSQTDRVATPTDSAAAAGRRLDCITPHVSPR